VRFGGARFGYDPGGSPPRVGFCDALTIAMADLNVSLEKAYALGKQNDPVVVQAAYVYDQNDDFWTRKWFTVPLTNQCTAMSAEVRATVARVNAVLASDAPPPLRPDYRPDDPFSLPTWLPLAAVGVVALVLLKR
jgi:hypothetical protein